MISNKKEVQILAALMLEKGITNVVISPGSRNAPLINTFDGLAEFKCYNVVDERSAAFFAMGLALRQKQPVAIACTSGSALLNYAPAAAEALYQKVPLLILSADRPREWVDQGDGQTIRQENALQNVVKRSIALTGGMRDETEKWHNTRLINEGLNALTHQECGPVHINFPFSEPLYDMVDEPLTKAKSITMRGQQSAMGGDDLLALRKQWKLASKKMVLVGQLQADEHLEKMLNKISQEENIVVLTEKTSNIKGEKILSSIDNMIFSTDDSALAPEMLITLGGQIVSKKIKAFLRQNKPQYHWHFSVSSEVQDTFMSLTDVISANPVDTLDAMPLLWEESEYAEQWQQLDQKTSLLNHKYVKTLDFCDFTVFDSLLRSIPEGTTLHLSNSTPVRYAQLFPMKNVVYQSNRGTSGIDGVISTAAGYASADNGLNILVIGDLSFFYDSNALWNHHYPNNLKIVLINNSGGGIFRFIPGPSDVPASEQHFVATHCTSAEGLVMNFGLKYSSASDQKSFEEKFDTLLKSKDAEVLEVFTPAKENAEALRGYFRYLKENL